MWPAGSAGGPRTGPARRRAIIGLAAGLLLVAAAGVLWFTGRPEPAGETVDSVGSSAVLRLTAATPPTERPADRSTLPPASSIAGPALSPPSAPPPPSPSPEPADPVRIRIDAIGVDAPVAPVGVTDDGDVQVPGDVATVGWYRYGPAPAAAGSAVLVGHVDDHRQGVGALARIGDLNPGDTLDVADNGGTTWHFQVVAREQFTKGDMPMARLFDRGGQARLVLITCGGPFDSDRLEYDDNIAVTAVPVG